MWFFFYGTLMDEAVRLLVMGPSARTQRIRPARLDGWRRVGVRGRHYPIVVPAAGHSVSGLVTDGVDVAAAVRLDRFEGPEYRRCSLRLRTDTGESVSAWVYVAKGAGVATALPWDYDAWCRRHRAAFLRWLGANPTEA